MIRIFLPEYFVRNCDNGQILPKQCEINQEHFPDGSLLLKIDNASLIDSQFITIVWNYENDAELFTIICLAKKFKSPFMKLIMPYIPHARQDRIKNEEDTFTLKYFAEAINSLGFCEVRVLDPHSPVSEALIDNISVESPKKWIQKALLEIEASGCAPVLYFPDAGACKRYSSMFPTYKYIYGNKKREWETGEIIGTEVVNPFNIDLKDKTILIIDDICSKGTTFVKSAEALKEYNVGKVFLWVTHCENTILQGHVLEDGSIEKVFTTNSIFNQQHEKIKVYDLIN